MSTYHKKYIVTGAPGTGKTTLINELAKAYACMPELSRQVITQEQANGGGGVPWQDVGRFAHLVYEAFREQLAANPEAIFTDRSVLDLIAYLQVAGKTVPLELDQLPYKDLFHESVLLAPTWEAIYHQDEQRQQEFYWCLKLERALIETYVAKGFEIVVLPKDNVPNRVNFVHSFINKKRT